jgi:hypothetical protein
MSRHKVGYNLPDIEKLILKVAAKNFSGQISISRALCKMLPFADKDMEKFLLSNPHLYCGGGTEKWGGKPLQGYFSKHPPKGCLWD